MSPWTIARSSGDAGPFHFRSDPVDPPPSVWVHRVDRPALVLGSSQPDDHIHRDRAEADGVEVCRRRTGGGLVHLVPGDHCWIDLIIPASSRLWDEDVGRAFEWVGEAWSRALTGLLQPDRRIEVHRGRLRCRAAGRILCFAGLGPGEVTVDGYKVIGLSQRRWRTGARFQCAAIWRWRPAELTTYLGPGWLGPDAPCPPPAELAVGLPPPPVPGAEGSAPELPGTEAVILALAAELPDP